MTYATPLVALTNEQLFRKAPSIFATEAWNKVSDKYQFIPTLQIVEKMREEGLFPVRAVQSRTRIAGKGDFTKHMIRFRPAAYMGTGKLALNEEFPEIVLVNSHDRSSGYQLSAGVFRLVCLNGMIAKSSEFGTISVRHSGKIIDDVIEGTYSIVESIPEIMGHVDGFKAITLKDEEREIFANAALQLRYPVDAAGNDTAPIAANDLLLARRSSDLNKPDLWTTFNTVQENFIKGGLRGRGTTGKRLRTRAIASVSEDVRMNKALWTLADEMRKLKAA